MSAIHHPTFPPATAQKKYFNANCMIRGSCADVTFPNVLLLSEVVGLVIRNPFVTLNASARNSTFCISLI